MLAALIAAIAYIESSRRKGAEVEAVSDARARLLLPVPIADLGAIEVAVSGTLHRFERDFAGIWFYHGVHATAQPGHGHTVDAAVAQRIEHTFAALDRARMERELKLDLHAGEYGVTTPRIILLVYAKGATQPLAQYAIGDVAPDGLSRYVLRVGSASVVTIATYQIDNLMNLIQSVSVSPLQPGKP